jgi:hypothetical protein
MRGVVEPMSSMRETIAAAAANSAASRMNPSRKNTANHASGAPMTCSTSLWPVTVSPTTAIAARTRIWPIARIVLPSTLPPAAPARDRRDQQLDDAGLLLFDDALRDRRAEGLRRQKKMMPSPIATM